MARVAFNPVVAAAGTSTDPERRAALNNLKLRALVRDHLGAEVDSAGTLPAPFGRGAAFVADGRAWVLIDAAAQTGAGDRGLGAALAWASKQPNARQIELITDGASGVLARRAALFATPITVWHAVERLLVAADPESYPESPAVDPRHLAFQELIEQGGADPIVEHGVLAGEVRGLEVCRVVTDAFTDEVRLEVGVGAHDREAFLMLHGARPTLDALTDVVQAVQQHRVVGAALHPLNRFGAERFLRWSAMQAPERLGAESLSPVEPPVVRQNLKDPVPCVALGRRGDGQPVVAVFSSGIDLDLIPFALDARQLHAPGGDLVVVARDRDLTPLVAAVAETAQQPPDLLAWGERG